jgi:hypothetical protein
MPYDEFQPLAQALLGLDVPPGTYDMQRSYLKHRTPEEMAEQGAVSLSAVTKSVA